MRQDKITTSLSEISAIVQCIIEVCRYAINLYKRNEDFSESIILYVINDVVSINVKL